MNKAKDRGKCVNCSTVVRDPVISTVKEFTENEITVVQNGKKILYNSLEECPGDLKEYYEVLDEVHELRQGELKMTDLKDRMNNGKREYMVDGIEYPTFGELPNHVKPFYRLNNRAEFLNRELAKQGVTELHRNVIDKVVRSGPAMLNYYKGGVTPGEIPDILIDNYRKEYDASPKEEMDFYHCRNCNSEVAGKSAFFGGFVCEHCKTKVIVFSFKGNEMTVSK